MIGTDHSTDENPNGDELEVMSLAEYEESTEGGRSKEEVTHIAVLDVPSEPVHAGLEDRGWLLCSEDPVKYVGGFEAAGVEMPGGVVDPMGAEYRLHAHTETALLEEHAAASPVTLQRSQWLQTGYELVFDPGAKPAAVLDGIGMVEAVMAGEYQ